TPSVLPLRSSSRFISGWTYSLWYGLLAVEATPTMGAPFKIALMTALVAPLPTLQVASDQRLHNHRSRRNENDLTLKSISFKGAALLRHPHAGGHRADRRIGENDFLGFRCNAVGTEKKNREEPKKHLEHLHRFSPSAQLLFERI